MDHPERRRVVEQRRNDGGLDDRHVRHVERLRHDERDGAHHRRHDLSTHARCRFDGARKDRCVTEALHQRDGELSDGEHVGDAGPRDRTHHAGRNDGDLRRAAAGMSDEPQGDAVEEIDHPCMLEEASKQDEQEDVRRRDQRRNPEQAFGAEKKLTDDLVEAVPAMCDHARQELAEQTVREKQAADDGQRNAQHPPRGFEDEHDEDRPDNEVLRARIA